MDRESIKLTNNQWCDLVWELYLKIDDIEIPVKEIDRIYNDSRRHTEEHTLIFQRLIDNKYFSIDYETSVKDEMGWEECNYGSSEATEVFPVEKTIISFE